MKDIGHFLARIDEIRRREQITTRAGFVAPPGLQLPPALEVAIKHGFPISPIPALSDYAPISARVGVASSEREQIEYWFARYGSDAQWLVETGESVVSLEIELRLAMQSLAFLAGDDRSWQRTLHFANRGLWFVLFKYAPGLLSFNDRYPGLRLHVGDSILIPPSRTPSGIELVYADPQAPLLSADWLRNAAALD